ncbi:MAG: butyrate kinase [Bacilli bacterium]|nr:butyrate kinase [Bacilli bacterium]
MTYRVLTINPGSTSTKIGLFEDNDCVFSSNVTHNVEELKQFNSISDQLGYRRDMILDLLIKNKINLDSIDAYVGRGGGLMAVEGGVYKIDEILLDHARRGANGVQHPANLGSQIANELARKFNKPAFVVNPPDTDELAPVAKVTGIKNVYRNVHLHALNLKETAIRHALSIGCKYEECNFIVCHIGGGVSVSAHKNGRMIDGNDIVGGEGPMAPTRCGSVPVTEIINLCYSGLDKKGVQALCTKTGGFVNHLNTSDAREVVAMVNKGNTYAKLVWDSFKYQIVKEIGSMATALEGKVDGILLGGGIVFDQGVVDYIDRTCSWIAPVSAYPGEFELEAMNAGALRVLKGEEKSKQYTGVPVWEASKLHENI